MESTRVDNLCHIIHYLCFRSLIYVRRWAKKDSQNFRWYRLE